MPVAPATLGDAATLHVVGDDADDLPLVRATFFVRRPLPLRLDVAPFAVAYVVSFGCYALVPELEAAAVIATPCLVLLHILAFLMTHWSVGVLCAAQLSPCPPHAASLVCTVAASGARALCSVEREAAAPPEAEAAATGAAPVPSLFFVYHKSKYLVEPSTDSTAPSVCRKLRMPCDEPLSFYTTTRGLQTPQAAREARARFGDNDFSIPRPAFSELLQEHALAPFFVFQMLCVLLLCLDDYWYYSVFTLLMLVLFECTVVKSRLRNVDELRELATPASSVLVFRSDRWVTLSSVALLPGDVLALTRTPSSRMYGGQIDTLVPADVVLVHGTVAINESSLTGESTPQLKMAVGALGDDPATPLSLLSHRASVVLGGTKLLQHTSGQQPKLLQPPGGGAVAVVLRTGFDSSQGKLMRTILFASERVTGSDRETLAFILFLLVFAVAAATHVLLEGLADASRSRYKLALHCLMIITSVVPPELPMELSLAVNNSLLALHRHDIFCTEPFRIPLAGKLSLCCFDKTGTLTSDDLVVQGVAAVPRHRERQGQPAGGQGAGGVAGSAGGAGAGGTAVGGTAAGSGAAGAGGGNGELLAPLEADLTCTLDLPGDTVAVLAGCHQLMIIDFELLGDPIDKAALGAVGWAYAPDGLCVCRAPRRRGALRILHRYPFSSELKRSSTIAVIEALDGAPVPAASRLRALCKGAPEAVRSLLASVPKGYDEAYLHHASQGKRVLALAWRAMPELDSSRPLPRSDVERELVFAGFLVLHCPAKPESAGVLATLAAASHGLQMITGDQLLTACHAASHLGLTHKPQLVLTLVAPDDTPSAGKADPPPRLSWRVLRAGAAGPAPELPAFEPTRASFRALSGRYALCVDGGGFDALGEAGVLGAALPYLAVLARMAPQQKERALLTLKREGVHTLMCGDGTNDVGALKRSDVGVALVNATFVAPPPRADADAQDSNGEAAGAAAGVRRRRGAPATAADRLLAPEPDVPRMKLGDASIAAAFTARSASVGACVDIIGQGRCTLVTTLQMCKILALNCLVSAFSLSVLHLKGVRMGDTQATATALSTALFFLFLSSSRPLPRLSPRRPPSSVLSPYIFCSIIAQVSIHLWALMRATALGDEHGGADAVEPDGEFEPNIANSIVWLVSTGMLITTFVVNYKGRPYMEALSSNRGLAGALATAALVILALTAGALPDLASYLELVPLEDAALRSELQVLLAGDFAACWLLERAISRVFRY